MSDEPTTSEERLRELAVRRVGNKADFRTHLLMYILVNAFLVVIWLMTGSGFFWPIFPIVGWGIGIVAHAWDAYGPARVTEERVQREMERLRRAR